MAGTSLHLKIEIRYLAERIDPDFTAFQIVLDRVTEISFKPWTNNPPAVVHDLTAIFSPELDILESKRTGETIQVTFACNQTPTEITHCGGDLTPSASSATVLDESNKAYSISDLRSLASGYWHDWAARNAPA